MRASDTIQNKLHKLQESLKKVNKSQCFVRKPRQSDLTNVRGRRVETNLSHSVTNSNTEQKKGQVRENALIDKSYEVQPCYIKFYKYEEVKKKYDMQSQKDMRRSRIK